MSMDIQYQIEELTNKYQLLPRLQQWIDEYPFDFEAYAEEAGIPYRAVATTMIMLAIYKRMQPTAILGILNKYFDEPQETADALERMIADGYARWDEGPRQVVVVLCMDDKLQQELALYQYPMPLVVPPKHMKANTDTGFYTTNGSVLLNHSHHEKDVCLDHINHINQTKFKVDMEVVHHVKNMWKHIDKPKDGESRDEFKKRRRAFDTYNTATKAVADALHEHAPEGVYFTHAYDKRGRFYVRGYHLNYQGNDWNKASILLAEEETITG